MSICELSIPPYTSMQFSKGRWRSTRPSSEGAGETRCVRVSEIIGNIDEVSRKDSWAPCISVFVHSLAKADRLLQPCRGSSVHWLTELPVGMELMEKAANVEQEGSHHRFGG
jgi:hypothetical protein